LGTHSNTDPIERRAGQGIQVNNTRPVLVRPAGRSDADHDRSIRYSLVSLAIAFDRHSSPCPRVRSLPAFLHECRNTQSLDTQEAVFDWFEWYPQATRVFLRQDGHSRKPFIGHRGAGCMSSHHVEPIHWSTRIAVTLDVGQKNTSEARSQYGSLAGQFPNGRTERLCACSNGIEMDQPYRWYVVPDRLSNAGPAWMPTGRVRLAGP
jgi:hypothetical protein